ncbi:hypothetical protein ACQSGI_24805 [Salmonella enterica]|uniref:hypothetical protein n=1 Tax=Salmonella enterica TaxID=28901 RepID=UPI003D315957
MTKTANPTITVTVSGPTGSGKSRVLAAIAGMLSLTCSNCTIETPDVEAEMKKYGNNYLNWPKARSGTIFKLEEINQPINAGRYSTHDIETATKKLTTARENQTKAETEIRNKIQAAITTDDLCNRPVPVHIQGLISMLGISFEEYQETDLQPVVDLVNWALCTPATPQTDASDENNPLARIETRLTEEVVNLADTLRRFSQNIRHISHELPDTSQFGKLITRFFSDSSLQVANALLKNSDKPLLLDDGVEYLRGLGIGLDDFIREIELDGRKFLAVAIVDNLTDQ